MLIKIWDVKDLAKRKGISVSIDNWSWEVSFKLGDWEEFIAFSNRDSYDAYVKELIQNGILISD